MNKTPVLSFFCFILAHRWGKDGNFLMDFLSNTISQKKTSCAARKKTMDTREAWEKERMMAISIYRKVHIKLVKQPDR